MCEVYADRRRVIQKKLFETIAEIHQQNQANYLMVELHEGNCGLHSTGCNMATRALRAGYYWPTMESDSTEYVKKCQKWKEFGNMQRTKPETWHHMSSPWPFAQWGINIIGPFSLWKGQCKFLLVVVDYFTKWIEVEPLAFITANKVQSFVWKNIVCRFGLSNTIISENERQFIDQGLQDFYKRVGNSFHHQLGGTPTNQRPGRGFE